MKPVQIKTIPAESHRYNTAGDYMEVDGVIYIMVAQQKNEDYDFLIALHEFVEEYLTRRDGIKEEDIYNFDLKLQNEGYDGEPGDHEESPYKKQHRFAENIERICALEMGVAWGKYEEEIIYKGMSDVKSRESGASKP